jgi:hypothetical protein
LRNAKIVVNLDEEKLIGKQNRLFDQEWHQSSLWRWYSVLIAWGDNKSSASKWTKGKIFKLRQNFKWERMNLFDSALTAPELNATSGLWNQRSTDP